jgi:hypothetical protein
MIIFEDTFINALYIMVTAFSTVGFEFLHKLSEEAKTFTIVLIFLTMFSIDMCLRYSKKKQSARNLF